MKKLLALTLLNLFSYQIFAQTAGRQSAKTSGQTSGNPIFPGWYADPEGIIFEKTFWIYPTFSAPYNKQVHMDAFSSKDLVTWDKHPNIIDTSAIKWAKRAMWAPSIIEKRQEILSVLRG
jgi:hypothetical protein